jgi:hypothetical protein
MSYEDEEEDTCMSYEEEDTCTCTPPACDDEQQEHRAEEEDICMSYEEEDTCTCTDSGGGYMCNRNTELRYPQT